MNYTDIGQAREIVENHKQVVEDPASVSNEALNAFLFEAAVLQKQITAAIDEGIERLKKDPRALPDWQLVSDPVERLTRK